MRRRTAEESEKRGRESWEVGGLRGGAAVTGEQWSRESKGKKGEFRSVLWIIHAGLDILIYLWFVERMKHWVRKAN